MKPLVALVGRPNVGKSTLFNRLTRSRDAIVDDLPGVTRDRHYGHAQWDDTSFLLVDTGGFTLADDDDFSGQIRQQVDLAIEEAHMIVMLLDGRQGVSPFDADLVGLLRQAGKPAFFVINKIDTPDLENNLAEFYALGIEHLFSLSAEHGYGVSEFLDALVAELPPAAIEPESGMIRLAVVGRPNVGKSSLINRLLGQNRLLVSDTPGTTRDAVDSVCECNGKSYLLIDTAGIRRKNKVSLKLEKFSIIKALKSMARCDVALVLIDAAAGITEQDIKIAGYAAERGCGCIFLLNKWDLIPTEEKVVRNFYDRLRHEAKFLSFAPAMTISALTGQRVSRIFSLVDEVYAQYAMRINTGRVNTIFTQATQRNEPPIYKGRRLKFFYATQTGTKPPTFVCFVNFPEAVHFSYQRYLINRIREDARLDKTPVRMIFRKRDGDRHPTEGRLGKPRKEPSKKGRRKR